MQLTTERLELRIMELEDAVKLLAAVSRTMNEMIGNLNDFNKLHAQLLQKLLMVLADEVKDSAE